MEHSIHDHVKRPFEDSYHYHVEDGKFLFEFSDEALLGKEGEVISFDGREVYILCIQDKYVRCIGNIAREFPKSWFEHFNLKHNFLDANSAEEERYS